MGQQASKQAEAFVDSPQGQTVVAAATKKAESGNTPAQNTAIKDVKTPDPNAAGFWGDFWSYLGQTKKAADAAEAEAQAQAHPFAQQEENSDERREACRDMNVWRELLGPYHGCGPNDADDDGVNCGEEWEEYKESSVCTGKTLSAFGDASDPGSYNRYRGSYNRYRGGYNRYDNYGEGQLSTEGPALCTKEFYAIAPEQCPQGYKEDAEGEDDGNRRIVWIAVMATIAAVAGLCIIAYAISARLRPPASPSPAHSYDYDGLEDDGEMRRAMNQMWGPPSSR